MKGRWRYVPIYVKVKGNAKRSAVEDSHKAVPATNKNPLPSEPVSFLLGLSAQTYVSGHHGSDGADDNRGHIWWFSQDSCLGIMLLRHPFTLRNSQSGQ